MATQVLMPALSPTMEEGKLAKWLVAEGDTITSGMVIAEIETDKATMEVEAVDEGILSSILVAEGTEGVLVNTPIAVIARPATKAIAPTIIRSAEATLSSNQLITLPMLAFAARRCFTCTWKRCKNGVLSQKKASILDFGEDKIFACLFGEADNFPACHRNMPPTQGQR